MIGMVHLAALPGAPGYDTLEGVIEAARADAHALAAGGCRGLMLENYGDTPFRARVESHTVAAMTAVAVAIRREVSELPLGINVLRNDALAALGIAVAVEARFVRVNVHLGSRWTDQGLIEGCAPETLRLRRALGAERIAVWADVDVKHSQPVADQPLAEQARELAGRGRADALIVSGSATGRAVDRGELHAVRESVSLPVLMGSGVTVENLASLRDGADGAIVGSALKRDGRVCVERVRALVGQLG